MKLILLENQLKNVIHKIVLLEYSEKTMKELIDKFKSEKPNLSTDVIIAYIEKFEKIKESPQVQNKDIKAYDWRELERVCDSYREKRIKAGKINDGEPSSDANLVYNENGLRIYVGRTKEACIKYGNGYSFCISARGPNNMYDSYRIESTGTPYFIFDDTKSSEQYENGDFKYPDHLLVLFVYEDYNLNNENAQYSVTTALNTGEIYYKDFNDLTIDYPKLENLENIFVPVDIPESEKKLYELKIQYSNEYEKLVESITSSNGIFYPRSLNGMIPLKDTLITDENVKFIKFRTFIDDETGRENKLLPLYGRRPALKKEWMEQKKIYTIKMNNTTSIPKKDIDEARLKFINHLKNKKISINYTDLYFQIYIKNISYEIISPNYEINKKIKNLIEEYENKVAKVKMGFF